MNGSCCATGADCVAKGGCPTGREPNGGGGCCGAPKLGGVGCVQAAAAAIGPDWPGNVGRSGSAGCCPATGGPPNGGGCDPAAGVPPNGAA